MFKLKPPIIASIIGGGNKSNNITSVTGRFAARSGLQFRFVQSHKDFDDGTEQNAFRHVLWQATITRTFGSNIATEAGNAHEINSDADLTKLHFSGHSVIENLAIADQTIDLLNNQIGRQIGLELKNVNNLEAAKIVLDKFRNDGFYTAQINEDKSVSIIKTKISDDKYNAVFNKISELSNDALYPHDQKIEDAKNQKMQESIEKFGDK